MKAEQSFTKKVFEKYMLPDKFPLVAINTFIAGYFFGEEGLGIFAFLLPIYYLFVVIGTWVNFGAFTLTMRSIGQDEGEVARGYSKLALTFSIAVGAILFLTLQIFFPQMLELLGMPAELFDKAEKCGRILLTVGLIIVPTCYAVQFLKIVGMQLRLKPVFQTMMILDAAVSCCCVKFLGFGLEGIAIGIGSSILFCLAFSFRLLHKNFGKNLFAPIREPIERLKKLLYAGSPMALSKFLSLSQIFLFNTICFKLYGTPGVAIFSAVLMAIRICRTPLSMSIQAITPMFLIELGDHNIKAIMLTLKETIRRGLTFAGLLPTLPLFFGASWFASKSDLDPIWHGIMADAFQAYALSIIFAVINSIFLTALLTLEHEIFANVLAVLRSFLLLAIFLAWQPEYLWWSFLFAEAVTFLILIAGIFFLQKFKGYRTPVLLEEKVFRPSCYEVFDYKEKNWATDKLEAFLEQRKISARAALEELQNWRRRFEENTPNGKKHYLAVHLHTDEKFLYMTLRDNGNRIERTQPNIKYALGLNNIYLRKSLAEEEDF